MCIIDKNYLLKVVIYENCKNLSTNKLKNYMQNFLNAFCERKKFLYINFKSFVPFIYTTKLLFIKELN